MDRARLADDYERHAAAAGGAVEMPPIDSIAAVEDLTRSVNHLAADPLNTLADAEAAHRAADRSFEVNQAAY